tara:strand:- start:9846 stop:11396 length:1551 start_codon:yes stop_codon:yes gene_type:complete
VAEEQQSPMPGASSGERYRFLVEHSGDIISTHRPGDWAYTSLNPALEQMSGYTAEELMGVPAYDLFHPDDAEAMKNKLIPAIYHHGTRTFRYRSRHKEGGYFWMESTHRSIRNDSGELLEILAITRDISEQVKNEELTRRMASVVDASYALILYCNRQHRISYMNAAASEVFDRDGLEELPHLSALLGEENYRTVSSQVFVEAGQRGRWKGALRLKGEYWDERYLQLEEVLAHSREDIGREGNFYSLIVRDLTDQKLAEKNVRDHQSELIHASRLMVMGEMASGLAHEINQPLATTLNYSRGAIRRLEKGEVISRSSGLKVLSMIVKQAQHAADIIKRLRSLVQKTPFQRRRFALQETVKEVDLLLSHDLWSQSVRIDFDMPDEDVNIIGDRIQIEQVLINLIRNSMDAYGPYGREKSEDIIPPRSKRRQIIVSIAERAKHVELIVMDKAGGLGEELQASLFEPYVTSKADGIGMGLSISRSIIEAHGGQISVSSDHKTSTTFTVVLPREHRKDEK